MRLSDVKGERTFEVIADIIEPIANIAADEEAAAFFARKKLPEGMTPRQFLLERAKKSVPGLLKNHSSDLIAILATIEGSTAEEYTEALNLVKLTKDCTELLTDDAFATLFISAQTETSSTSAPESTKEAKK